MATKKKSVPVIFEPPCTSRRVLILFLLVEFISHCRKADAGIPRSKTFLSASASARHTSPSAHFRQLNVFIRNEIEIN